MDSSWSYIELYVLTLTRPNIGLQQHLSSTHNYIICLKFSLKLDTYIDPGWL